jgi:steroid 5-alpha reductase family enzyme
MNFVLIAWLTFFINGNYYTRQIVVFVMVNVWGFRLGIFLLYRVLQRGKDDRFNEMREDFFKFLGFWVFQMFWYVGGAK